MSRSWSWTSGSRSRPSLPCPGLGLVLRHGGLDDNTCLLTVLHSVYALCLFSSETKKDGVSVME